MPNDLPISAVAPVAPAGAREAAPAAAVPSPRVAGTAGPALPNPSLRLDPELGLVVIELRNASGAVENSYPTARQLAAYRAHGGTGPSQPTTTAQDGAAAGTPAAQGVIGSGHAPAARTHPA